MELLKLKAVELVKAWLKKKSSEINQTSVMRTVYQEVDISAGYFLVLTIANLIALAGLITNNTAVIIGAMLISPLMGPILSSGFAFITGNVLIGKKALTTMVKSVVVTIIVAAIATWLSPLEDVTQEILARTRPNLYDLAIAFLAGLVGAMAICTKRSYITIVPGVAIATAVIPPLSVAGYGLGSAHFSIALGGFFLFFTNFVAIILSTCIVFFIYGFRPGSLTGTEMSKLKKRIIALGALLLIISIPLLYTLHVSISEVRLRSGISTALKKAFDQEKVSYISNFEYRETDEALRIRVAIHTTSYMDEARIQVAEKDLGNALDRKVALDVEQILMHAGGLKQVSTAGIASMVPFKSDPKKSVEAASHTLADAASTIERIVAPYRVAAFYIGRRQDSGALQAILRVRRDEPFTPDEKAWLGKMVSEALGVPVELLIETAPFLDPIPVADTSSPASDELRAALQAVSELHKRQPSVRVTIAADQSSGDSPSRRRTLATERARAVKKLLVNDYGIPSDKIRTTVAPGRSEGPTVRIKVVSG